MLAPSQVRALYQYNERVFDRFAHRVRHLGWSSARKDRGIGHGSLFGTLVHILNVEEVWIGYILQGRNSDAELEALFRDPVRKPKDWAGFARYRRRVRGIVANYMGHLDTRKLATPVHVFWMPGRYTASDGLLQVTIEQAHHLGEIIGACWQQGLEPPEMTWIRVSTSVRSARSG